MMNPGGLIHLRAYGGEEIIRHVVKVDSGVVLVCKEEEYQAAQAEGREPMMVGFRFEYILESPDGVE